MSSKLKKIICNKNPLKEIIWNLKSEIDDLPNTITEIEFGPLFNDSINNLPDSIKYITFHEDSLFNLSN